MEIKTKNFGVVEFQENDPIYFPKGLPGLPSLKKFLIFAFNEMLPLKFLQSIEEPVYSLVLVNPLLLDPSYNYELSEEDYTDINLQPNQEVLQYIIVTVPNDPTLITGNFKAPVIINTKTMHAKQVILADSKYSVSASVPEILNSQSLDSEMKS
jgi:flagellar assembly factor FliW